MVTVTQADIDSFQTDGVAIIRGLFADHLDTLRAGIARNMSEPGPYAAENLQSGEAGRFFDDYCNWMRIPAFEKVIRQSDAATVAAQLMGSRSAQFFHDHVLVKAYKHPATWDWAKDPSKRGEEMGWGSYQTIAQGKIWTVLTRHLDHFPGETETLFFFLQ